jgi:DNA polymerase III subunit delta
MSTTEELLAQVKQNKTFNAYVFWGEELLVRQGADALVKALVPDAAMGLNLSVLDGASAREVAADLATFSLFPGRKVVLLHDPEFLAPKKGRVDALSKARDAWKSGKRKEAARRVLALAARAGWGPADLDPRAPGSPSVAQWDEELGVELADADVTFLQEVAAFCKDERLTAPDSDVTALVELLEKGLPKDQILVIATTEADAKSPLLKWVQKHGQVIDRKVSGRLKDLDVSESLADTLGRIGKTLAPAAETLLKERCGGNMRLLQSELEKLALYTSKNVIQVADVELLVGHAREEEFLELSDALQKRDLTVALKYVDHAVEQGSHPLMLLGAIASIVRTLIENHGRLQELARGTAPRSFDDFKRSLFPRIEQDAKAVGARVPHPYAAFLGMQAAGRYSKSELLKGLLACADADIAIKSSAPPKLTTERVLWTLCQR